jgi:hypothetical protein
MIREARDCGDNTAVLAKHRAMVDALCAPGAYDHPVDTVEVIETHISTVLLAGAYAYKLKKPVNLGFVDFSTPIRRRFFCEEELRLNRRTAPLLYLAVVAVVRTLDGRLRVAGGVPSVDAAVLDHAVQMHRFASAALFDRLARAGRLTRDDVDGLARALGAFHAALPPAPPGSVYGTSAHVGQRMDQTLQALGTGLTHADDAVQLRALQQWAAAAFSWFAPLFAARHADGHVRECHGDLHLGNIARIDGAPVAFDCIEFDPDLRWIDVACDLAFPFMDLLDHGLPRLAWRLLDGWLHATGDIAALGPLRYYAIYRALVRALVATLRGAQTALEKSARQPAPASPGLTRRPADSAPATHEAPSIDRSRYIALAASLAAHPQPRLVLTCGLSGSGKSTVAQSLLEQLGAVRLRSDVERKRRHGVSGTGAGVETTLYSAATTASTYRDLLQASASALGAGHAVVVDAAFLRHADRASFRALAHSLQVPFSLVECTAPEAVLQDRIARRAAAGTDASDATLAVLQVQIAGREPLQASERATAVTLDTDCDPMALDARCGSLAAAWRRGESAGPRP